MDSTLFDSTHWRSGSIHDLEIPCRYQSITSEEGKQTLRKYFIGWCKGENLICRPKKNHIATMFFKDGIQFWFHLRNIEFYEVFVKDQYTMEE